MLTVDHSTQAITARDEAGKLLWQGEVFAEDERGLHPYRSGKAGPWRVQLDLSSSAGFDLVGLVVKPRPGAMLRRIVLRLPGGAGAVPSLTSAHNRMLGLSEHPFGEKGVVPLGKGRVVSSRFFTVLHRPGGRSLVVGVGELGQDFSFLRAEGEALEAGFEPERLLHAETRYCLAFATGKDPLELMSRYGRYLSRFARRRAGPISGWNSWDYYGASVTMDDLRQEMVAITASPLKEYLTHFAVDMGWWRDWGDGQLNGRFPASFRAVAEEISEAGFIPGIWYAPLQCSPWTHIGRHRQDLLVPAEGGGPVMQGGNALLDWSKPEVLHLLYEQFHKMRKAGFRYFKLDFIYTDAVRAMTHRADQSIGPLAVIRRGLQAIREAVGEDSYILNCGAAREASVGITDGSRICTDIHTFWSHIWNDAKEIACHLWENGSLWNVDPDFAVVRSSETSDDPFRNYAYARRAWAKRSEFWMAGPEASFSELRVWLTVASMSGGDLFLGDSIARLNRDGLHALMKLFPRPQESARPLDLFINPSPRFWWGGSDGAARLAVFNWDDQPSPVSVPDGVDLPAEGVDVWSGERVRIGDQTTMLPRSAYLLEV